MKKSKKVKKVRSAKHDRAKSAERHAKLIRSSEEYRAYVDAPVDLPVLESLGTSGY